MARLPQTVETAIATTEANYRGNVVAKGKMHREKLGTAPFIAWDGEGYSDDSGEHHYMLFGNSVGESVRGTSLDYRDCFPLLVEQRHGINVIFGGDYDIIMMIHTMPMKIRERLHSGMPTKFDGWRMQWYRRKKFYVKHLETGRSTVLYDVLSFFQCSFVKACTEYLGEDETLIAMHEMKLKRDSFTYNDSAVDPYWKSELEYLVRLMDELRRLFIEVDIKPYGWHGPGAVATGLMHKHKMARYRKPIPDAVVDVAEHAYFGGRFEHFKVGKIDKVYQYDIRSAYPKAISLLPDFCSATWQHFTEDDISQEQFKAAIVDDALYCVSWDIPARPWRVGPLPWRNPATGNVYFPLGGARSWYWGIEVRAALAVHPHDWWTVHEVWIPNIPNKDVRPYAWISQMFDDRARMKMEGNPAEKALKLGMNSVYGKLAQSKGARFNPDTGWKKPPWHNMLAAGWITAYTRAVIFNALIGHEVDLVAIETDALFLCKPAHELPVSTSLGDWECTQLDQILYVHSGVYYALQGDKWKLKTRGLEADRSKTAEQWLEIFQRLPFETVPVANTVRRFGTDVRTPPTYARWLNVTLTMTLPAKASKRVHLDKVCPVCVVDSVQGNRHSYADWFHGLTVPPPAVLGSDHLPSAPHKLPWRNDVKWKWPSNINSEVIEGDNLTYG